MGADLTRLARRCQKRYTRLMPRRDDDDDEGEPDKPEARGSKGSTDSKDARERARTQRLNREDSMLASDEDAALPPPQAPGKRAVARPSGGAPRRPASPLEDTVHR